MSRRVYEMCARVLAWTAAHPDDDAGFQVLVGRLEELAARIGRVVDEQRDGLIDVRAAAARKRELRRAMLAVPIAHLAEVGRLAAGEQHELRHVFRFRPSAQTYVAFLAAARGMYDEANTHREVLRRHGLSEAVLAEFGGMIEELDAAIRLGDAGRTTHTAATRELAALTMEVGRTVRAMDAHNRVRFRDDRTALEQWLSARTIRGTPRASPRGREATEGIESPDTPAPDDVRPAA